MKLCITVSADTGHIICWCFGASKFLSDFSGWTLVLLRRCFVLEPGRTAVSFTDEGVAGELMLPPFVVP